MEKIVNMSLQNMFNWSYYDKILFSIAFFLFGGFIIGILTGVSISATTAAGSVMGSVFLYDCIFRNPPLKKR